MSNHRLFAFWGKGKEQMAHVPVLNETLRSSYKHPPTTAGLEVVKVAEPEPQMSVPSGQVGTAVVGPGGVVLAS